MTAQILRQRAARWLDAASKNPVARLMNRLSGPLMESLTGLVILAVLTSLLGGAMTAFAPVLFNLPDVLGQIFAGWCVERGSCDLITNLASVALGIFLPVAVGVIVVWAAAVGLKENKQSIYYSVREELERAGEAGVEPIKIAKRTGIGLSDAHTMLAYLFDDGEVEVCQNGAHGVHVGRVRYRLVKDK